MDRYMWAVNSSKGQMMSCYERIRLNHYAEAFRDLSSYILRGKEKLHRRTNEDGSDIGNYSNQDERELNNYLEDSTAKIYEHFEEESLRHLGLRMRDAAELFDYIAKEQGEFESPTLIHRKMLENKLKRAGYELYDILVIRKENSKEFLLSVRSNSPILLETEDAARILSDCFKEKIVPSLECPIFVSKEFNEYLFETASLHSVLCGQAGISKIGEICSGDNYSFVHQRGKFIGMLSDGTGVGESARRDSGSLLDLAENYLESGFDSKKMLGFLEGMLFEKYLENRVPTLDYIEIDLNTGEMNLAKFGSATTILWHEGKITKLAPENLLLGYEDLEKINWSSLKLNNGDFVLLMSDGVADNMLDVLTEPEFEQCIRDKDYRTPTELAKAVLEMAIDADEGRPHDDMTVLVMELTGNR